MPSPYFKLYCRITPPAIPRRYPRAARRRTAREPRLRNRGSRPAALQLGHDLAGEELGVSDVLHFHPAHHLARDGLQVLIVDVDALQAVDFLNLVDQVLLQFLFTEYGQDVVRIARAVHERFAGFD